MTFSDYFAVLLFNFVILMQAGPAPRWPDWWVCHRSPLAALSQPALPGLQRLWPRRQVNSSLSVLKYEKCISFHPQWRSRILCREYWMIYWRPDFLAVGLFLAPRPTLLRPLLAVSSPGDTQGDWERKNDQLADGRGGGGRLPRGRIIRPQESLVLYDEFFKEHVFSNTIP